MATELKFKILERTSDECIHDTGLIHSLGLSCIDVERQAHAYAIYEDDPDHDRIWHNKKLNPNLTILEV